jgi:uncharacterized protein
MLLEGANVLITGASRGIGESLARAFAKEGSKVVIAARSEAPLAALAKEIGADYLVVDLTKDDDVTSLIGRAEAINGGIDVLVNNAGVETVSGLTEQSIDTLRTVARVNFEAPVLLTRDVLPGMHQRGRGHLVLAGTAGFPGMATYAGTKAGLTNFAASMRLELNDTNIGTTIVAPGPVDTRMWAEIEHESYNDEMLARFNRLHLIPKLSPDKLAARTIKAVLNDRRHVRHPRRLAANFWLNEAPRRLSESLMTGIKFRPPVAPGDLP